jgi:hypothetical protein
MFPLATITILIIFFIINVVSTISLPTTLPFLDFPLTPSFLE